MDLPIFTRPFVSRPRLVRRIVCTGLAAAGLTLAPPARAAELFWTELRPDDSGGISKVDLVGGPAESVIPGGLRGAFRMAVDSGAEKLYWSSIHGDGIQRSNLDGTQLERFYADSDPILGLAVDPLNGRILYYKDEDIRWASIDDGVGDTLLEDFGPAENITVDAAAGKLYLGQRGVGGNGKIWRANLDGSDLEEVVSGIFNGPIGLGVDSISGAIFWAQSGVGQRGIRRADPDGSNVVTLVDDVDADALIVDPAGQLFWTSSSPGGDWIERSDFNGAGRSIVQSGVGAGGIVLIPEPAAALLLGLLAALSARRPAALRR